MRQVVHMVTHLSCMGDGHKTALLTRGLGMVQPKVALNPIGDDAIELILLVNGEDLDGTKPTDIILQ